VHRKVVNAIALALLLVGMAAVGIAALGGFSGGDRAAARRRVDTGVVGISIEGLAFTKGTRTVAVGTSVTWKNLDDTTHTVTARDGTSFDSGPLRPGATYTHVFSRRGTFEYLCTFHPFIKATITVVLPYGLEPG
jgi:plastocyanin